MADYVILSPYIIPTGLPKARNVGDGLISMRIEELLRPHTCVARLTSRAVPTAEEIDRMNEADFVVLGGANQLHDEWQVVPGGLPVIERISVPIVPFGVGVDGRPEKTRSLSPSTRAALRAVHERIPASSWRCPETTAYLTRELPDLADRFVMTGCPVACGAPLLAGDPFPVRDDTVVVTVTDRESFWARESATLRVVAERFPDSARILALHQDFSTAAPAAGSPLRRLVPRRTAGHLHRLAGRLGFEVRHLDSVEAAIATYQGCDLHIGSRVHAHLFSLSLARRSVVTKVDERVVGLSRAYGFPIAEVPEIPARTGDIAGFERHRDRVRQLHGTMTEFIGHAVGARA